MIQIYVPYWEWEDWINGMYNKVDHEKETELTETIFNFMSDVFLFSESMRQVINEWPKTMINNLTNPSINKRAFVGQCACFHAHKCPEYITRQVWATLSDTCRHSANKEAEKHINNWTLNYETEDRKLHKNVGTKMLF